MSDKNNKKLPKCSVNRGDTKPKYGYVYGEADACGGGHLRYRNPAENDKTWEQTVKPSGNYQTIEHDQQQDVELHTHLHPGHTRVYVGKGHSKQIDGQHDVNGEKTGRHEYGGDAAYNKKGDHYEGSGGKRIWGTGGGVFEHHTSPDGGGGGSGGSAVGGIFGDTDSGSTDQETKHNKVVDGDTVTKNKGNHHSNREGDEVTAISGNKLTMIKKGDYATNVQGGNWDSDVSQKARFKSGDDMAMLTDKNYSSASKEKTSISSGKDMTIHSDAKNDISSKSDMTISSDSKITIKVGGSSITIEDGTITIKASKIKFEEG